jgi:hypothetical protein
VIAKAHWVLLMIAVAAMSCGADVRLESAPRVSADGRGVRIEFAASEPTDVEVAILDATGKVVRHLAAGMLGEKAPPPLQRGKLQQKLVWDRTDDAGRPVAPAAGARVRVRLGMGAKLHRIMGGSAQGAAGGVGLTCGPDGTLYVLRSGGLYAHRQTTLILAYGRDGRYLRQLYPGPADLPAAKRAGWPWAKLDDGREVPVVHHLLTRSLYPAAQFDNRTFPVVTRDGRLVILSGALHGTTIKHADVRGGRRPLVLGTDGSVPAGFLGPIVAPAHYGGFGRLALSPDEKTLYVSGLYEPGRSGKGLCHVVWRMPLDGSAKPAVFLGKLFTPLGGSDGLNDPQGIAVDAQGNLYVADYGNNRIAVFKADGAFLRALPVEYPDQVRVHRRTGAVYVMCLEKRAKPLGDGHYLAVGHNWKADRIVKFGSLADKTPAATLAIKQLRRRRDPARYGGGGRMALDDSARQAVLWVHGLSYGDGRVVKVVDEGDALVGKGDPMQALAAGGDVAVLPNVGDVLVLTGKVITDIPGFGSNRRNRSPVFDPDSGARKAPLVLRKPDGNPENVWSLIYGEMAAGMDGLFYVHRAADLRRYDAEGKPAPFASAGKHFIDGLPFDRHTKNSTLFVRPAGDIYLACHAAPTAGPSQALDETVLHVRVVGPDGSIKKRDLIRVQGARLGGLVVDSKGNVYLGAQIRRADEPPIPSWFAGKLPPDGGRRNPSTAYRQYAAILKFGPEGGEVVLDKRGTFIAHRQGRNRVSVRGGRLIHRGGMLSAKRDVGCNCEATRFDVDRFDRLYVPDVFRFCVDVIDSEGNRIASFGDYGNLDSRGESSPVPTPQIPLGWPICVDHHGGRAYVADLANRRVVAVNLTHAAEAIVPIQ